MFLSDNVQQILAVSVGIMIGYFITAAIHPVRSAESGKIRRRALRKKK